MMAEANGKVKESFAFRSCEECAAKQRRRSNLLDNWQGFWARRK
jgi:hypothetical protein